MAKKAQHPAKSLVIVESPTKAKTINRYLGSGYTVMASMGHVRDLPPNDVGIDFESGFEPVYQILDDKRRVVAELKKAASKARDVYLATDLDREGEAIAWHLVHALGLKADEARRVVFNEITRSAIQAAFASPHSLDMDKVNAQQARRLLDRIVGYQLSPLLQAKIARGLSAGRVQSVAVRLIVEREQGIRAFMPKESWRISACFTTDPAKTRAHTEAWKAFLETGKGPQDVRTVKQRNSWLSKHGCVCAELVTLDGKEYCPSDVTGARAVAETLGFVTDRVDEREWEAYADRGLKTVALVGRTEHERTPPFAVKDVQKRRTTGKPSPPFTTAALQQAASSTLGFGPSRTMRVAQQLYEGVDLGGTEGQVGLITYMRTDSTNLSRDSIDAVRKLIKSEYGERHLPPKPNVFGKAKRAQEAHEAIRPSDVARTPEALKGHLSREQARLYELIWRRFVACQMTPAQWDNTTALISADTPLGEVVFKAAGRRLAFDGYLRVAGTRDNGDVVLPELEAGSKVGLLQLDPQQQYSSPPPRYSEATLVKRMEAEGIGRPSTYAAVIQTIQDRSYADLVEKRFRPTALGETVTEQLVAHFPGIMDVKFTSHMEDELDKVEDAHLDWVHVLGEFYEPFREALERAQTAMQPVRSEPSDYECPKCGKEMVYRHGKNGRFLSCSGYPECKVSKNIDSEGKPVDDIVSEEPCPVCGKAMILRRSRMGPFLGCSGYPDCTRTMPADENGVPLKKVDAKDIQETCEECGAPMAVKFARGRSFLGCTKYPKCRATRPMPPGVYVEKPKPQEAGVRCDKCGRPMVIRSSRRGPFMSCSGFPRCRNAMPTSKKDDLLALEAEGKIPDPPPEPDNGPKVGKKRSDLPRTKDGKVDIAALGPPPPGFAWTRTGRPVVESWPEEPLTCPQCGQDCTLKTGRFGPYFGCTAYPRCSFVANLRGAAKKRAEVEVPGTAKPKPIPTDIPCAECGEPMVIRSGRSGQFLGCSKYPKCKATKPIPNGQSVESLSAAAAK